MTQNMAYFFWIAVCLVCVGSWLSPPWYAYIPLWFIFQKCIWEPS